MTGAGAIVIENCAIATMDGPRDDQSGTEHRSGHIVLASGRITAVGEGPAADLPDGARRVDGTGCLATPGLINTHHHLYQWLTQGQAQQSVLFDWLTELYPVWGKSSKPLAEAQSRIVLFSRAWRAWRAEVPSSLMS